MLKKKKKDTNLNEKLKSPRNGMNCKNSENIPKVEAMDKEDDFKYLEEKEHEIEKISRKIYEENSKIKKINLHHKIIKQEFEKKKLIDQSEKKKQNTPDYYKKITTKLQNNINNVEEYINNITNDINILKSCIDDERNERIIYNNNMKILVNEYNTLKKSISSLIDQEKEQNAQNEKLKLELSELNKEKDTLEKKHREDFKTLQQKLKEQKILSSEQKIHELIKLKYNCKERKNNKTMEECEEEFGRKNEKNAVATNNVNNKHSNERISTDDNYPIVEDYEDEKKKKLNSKIFVLKKLCLRILFINEYQKQNIKKLEENIENMNNAINSINILTSKKGDFDHIIINLNASKEKNYSLISRINLLNYETNILTKLNKKMKEKFKNINTQNDEIVNLKKEITNKMNDKMNHIKTSLLNNQETCKLKKKCFNDCVMYLKCLYEFIKKFENNNKLNLRTQIINKEKNFHFNYIHKYNEQILVDENHLNDFLIFIEKYIYALNFYLPSPTFNYKNFIIENPNFTTLISSSSTLSTDVSNENIQFISSNCLTPKNELPISEVVSPPDNGASLHDNEPVNDSQPVNDNELVNDSEPVNDNKPVNYSNNDGDLCVTPPKDEALMEGDGTQKEYTVEHDKISGINEMEVVPNDTHEKKEQDELKKADDELGDNKIREHTLTNREVGAVLSEVENENFTLQVDNQKCNNLSHEKEEENILDEVETKGPELTNEAQRNDNLVHEKGQGGNDIPNGLNEGDILENKMRAGSLHNEKGEDASDPNGEHSNVPNEEQINMPNDEQLDMPNDEQLDMPNDEQLDVPNDEQLDMPNDEQLDMPNDEQVDVPNDEQVDVPNDEQVDVPNDEQIDVPNDEQVDVPNDEQIDVPNDEQVDAPNDEQVDAPNDEQVDTSNVEQVDTSNVEQVDTSNVEQITTSTAGLVEETPLDEQENGNELDTENENYNLNHFNSRSIEHDKLQEEIPNELLTKKYDSSKKFSTVNN
ncbi:hypothetical protein, conserved [Plasmodium gonderi]|uniref:Uncharacterized protein n=1 Tax=Plasmodium gonderi TaxID=77519 RepID=A0A1Y1JCE9_PLAGO|nr:hypothetical protein, conserved [Plasmodium gonderi]GAW78877.1 hypothetical protein, conserved [Plasmodium gonderi]